MARIVFSNRLMVQYYNSILDNGWADQTIKNRISGLKKEGKNTEYLALLSAYNRVKLERELATNARK